MPQNENFVGTINGVGTVMIYNLEDETSSLNAIHAENGYGLSWSPFTKGHLLTGSDDKLVKVTDIDGFTSIYSSTSSHTDIVNDAQWHNFDKNLFASVSDDKTALVFDIRTKDHILSHTFTDGINSIAFSPFSQNLFAIGSTNSNIGLLDLRKLGTGLSGSSSGLLHSMMGHSDSITCLQFSPHNDGILASGSQDRRLIIWDILKIGEEQQQEDAEDGCPEIYMMHAGHTAAVSDLSWCPYKPWTLASTADDNLVHVWEVGKSALDGDDLAPVSDDYLE